MERTTRRPVWVEALLATALLLAVEVRSAAPAASAEPSPAPAIEVAVERGLLTVEVREARLAHVLRVIGERAGLTVTTRGDLSGRITQSFSGVPLEEGIRRLAQGYSLVLSYSPSRDRGEKPVLTHVSVLGSTPSGPGGARADVKARGPRYQGAARLGPRADGAGAANRSGSLSGDSEPTGATGARGGMGASAAGRETRLTDVQTLASRHDDGAVADLARILSEDPDPLVRAQAAATLGILGGEKAGAALAAALVDNEGAVRLHAVRALGKVQGADALPALREIVTGDPDPGVRRVAVRWLGALPGEEARAALEAAASDRDASVRQEAAEALTTWHKRIP